MIDVWIEVRLVGGSPSCKCFSGVKIDPTLWQKKVERIRRIPSHGVAASMAFGINR